MPPGRGMPSSLSSSSNVARLAFGCTRFLRARPADLRVATDGIRTRLWKSVFLIIIGFRRVRNTFICVDLRRVEWCLIHRARTYLSGLCFPKRFPSAIWRRARHGASILVVDVPGFALFLHRPIVIIRVPAQVSLRRLVLVRAGVAWSSLRRFAPPTAPSRASRHR